MREDWYEDDGGSLIALIVAVLYGFLLGVGASALVWWLW